MTAATVQSAPRAPGRWFLVLGFIGTTLGTSIAGYVVNSQLAEKAVVQSEKQSKRKDFEQSSAELKVLLKRLNDEAVAGRPLEATKRLIEINLLSQMDQAAVMRPFLDASGRTIADGYGARLADFSDALEDFKDTRKTGPYSQAAGNLLEDQSELLKAMQRASGLKTR